MGGEKVVSDASTWKKLCTSGMEVEAETVHMNPKGGGHESA